MMKYLPIIVIAILAAGVLGAQGKGIEGLPVKIGDSVAKVQAALGTTLQPESIQSAAERDAKAIRLETKGITVSFNRDGRAYAIRLNAPFAGNVSGVKLGHTRAFLVEKLGEPAKVLQRPAMMESKPYLYRIDDVATVRFDFDQDDRISAIYIFK